MSLDIRDRIVEFKRINASELTPHPQNWRKHPKAQQAAMSGILKEVGYVDAIMVREHDGGYQIIDGHLRAETTPDTTVPVLVVDLDDAETALVLATFDPIGAMAEPSKEHLDALLQQVNTTDAGLQALLADVAKEANLYLDDKYTTKVESPIYEINGPKPKLDDLYDSVKCKELNEQIDKSNVTLEEKDFLRIAAQRHTAFSYSKIAEFYAHSDKEMQELMEKSALVIIDFDKAVELGFVKLHEDLKKLSATNE